MTTASSTHFLLGLNFAAISWGASGWFYGTFLLGCCETAADSRLVSVLQYPSLLIVMPVENWPSSSISCESSKRVIICFDCLFFLGVMMQPRVCDVSYLLSTGTMWLISVHDNHLPFCECSVL
jgi:hypothetical protein